RVRAAGARAAGIGVGTGAVRAGGGRAAGAAIASSAVAAAAAGRQSNRCKQTNGCCSFHSAALGTLPSAYAFLRRPFDRRGARFGNMSPAADVGYWEGDLEIHPVAGGGIASMLGFADPRVARIFVLVPVRDMAGIAGARERVTHLHDGVRVFALSGTVAGRGGVTQDLHVV